MDYMILDSLGNAVYSSEDETDARTTLRAIVATEPEAADHLGLLAYDDQGIAQGPAVMFTDLPPAAVVMESQWVAMVATVATASVVTQPHVVPLQPWCIRVDSPIVA